MHKTFAFVITLATFVSLEKIPVPKIHCAYTDQHITINGFLEDWGGLAGTRVTIFSDEKTDRDPRFINSARFTSRWSETHLFLAFFVADKNLNAFTLSDIENARQDDAIEIWIDAANDSGTRINENDYHIIVGLNNNINEMRGREKALSVGERVPRILSRNLKIQSYVRPFGTVNQNNDVDSGYSVEMAIEWKGLGVNSLKQNMIRIEIGVLDLDTNAFDNPDSWKTPYYSEFMYSDKNYQRIPNNWPLLILSDPPVVSPVKSDDSPFFTRNSIILFLSIAACTLIIFLSLFIRIKRLKREMQNRIIIKLQQYIDNHYKEKISIDDFCKLYNYSEKQVQKAFKVSYSTTFANVLLQKRMEEAKRLLESSDKNVTEVCFEVGFNDASYFTKTFKNFFKILPKEVKKTRSND